MKGIAMSFGDAPERPRTHFEFFMTYRRDNGEQRYIKCLLEKKDAKEDGSEGRITPEDMAGFLHQTADAVMRDSREGGSGLHVVGRKYGIGT